ncbi:MAG: radical SAM protein [Calditerrivibrio sp.]|nr:radical SAM protein [Calditerrivibrio sp.]
MGNFKEIFKLLFKKNISGQLIIQITDHCNATCPQCGMNKNNSYKRWSLPRDEVLRIIDEAVFADIKAISFTGGEPLLLQDELFSYIRYASSKGIIFTRTGTNGFIFMGHTKSDFEQRIHRLAQRIKASNLYTFWISIDTYDVEKHESNRGLFGVIKGIEKGLKIFEQYSLYPSVNLGINRLIETGSQKYDLNGKFNPDQFYESYSLGLTKFFKFVIDLGFTIANLCYPMSFDGAVYRAESSERLVKYDEEEKKVLFRVIYDTIPKFRDKIRIFTPLSSINVLMAQYKGVPLKNFSCRGGKDFFFVDSTGETYPCGFLSDHRLGVFHRRIEKVNFECVKCDWECFRDPSVLFSPLINLKRFPIHQINDIFKNNTFYRDWVKDLLYYRKCGFFNMHSPKSF